MGTRKRREELSRQANSHRGACEPRWILQHPQRVPLEVVNPSRGIPGDCVDQDHRGGHRGPANRALSSSASTYFRLVLLAVLCTRRPTASCRQRTSIAANSTRARAGTCGLTRNTGYEIKSGLFLAAVKLVRVVRLGVDVHPRACRLHVTAHHMQAVADDTSGQPMARHR